MKLIEKLKPSYLLYSFMAHTSKIWSDKFYLECVFPARVGYRLNLSEPKTFNEKLQWLKLYYRKPIMTQMVDKIEAKKYVASIIGEIALLFMSKQNSSYQKLNFLSFYAYALSIGGGVGMIGYGLNQAQAMLFYKVVMSSFVMTTAVFGAFSVFSILTHQRIGIYLGSALLTLVLGIISIFVFNVMMEAVLGLIIGCLYVIVDTQTIIRRTEEGQFDVVRDAKMLFVDFVKIFIEILKILQENKKKDEEKDKKKK